MLSTVDALVPLSLLEAVREADTPGDLDAEFVDELRSKRLGLSDTVYSQIRRYAEAVKRHQRISQDEAAALAGLIGRRPDAEAVFRAAGRAVARAAYTRISPLTRRLLRLLPSIVGRPWALRCARRLADRHLNGVVRRVGGHVLMEVPRSVTRASAPGSVGCTFYESALRELLRLLIGSIGPVDHIRCESRGDGTCEWRADWRAVV